MTTAEFCASSTALLSISSNLGPSMAINIFHRCLVGSWPFAGACRFLAGLFTFFSRWPIVNQLRASGRTWFRFIIMIPNKTKKFSALPFMTIYRAAKCGPFHIYLYMQMNGRKVVIWLETDVGRELPLTWSDVIHPGLAELSSLYVLTTDFSPQ